MNIRKILILAIFLFNLIHLYPQSSSSNATIDINLENALLTEIFSKLQEKSGYTFTYGGFINNNTNRYDVVYTNTSVSKILENLSSSAQFSYWIEDDNINITSQSTSSNVSQQQVSIKGFVYDTQELPEALPGVNVQIKDGSSGTMTDMDGSFSLSAPIGDTLVFSMLGFKSFEYPVELNLKVASSDLSDHYSLPLSISNYNI